MNFTDLYAKIRALDENLTVHPVPAGASSPEEAKRLGALEPQSAETPPKAPEHTDGQPAQEEIISLGGPMPSGMMGMPHHQEDSVTMNVSMNGSGPGGISDLMKILRNIESGEEHGHEPIVSEPHSADGEVDIELDEQHGDAIDADKGTRIKNRPHRVTYGIDAVTKHGNDMHSKGDIRSRKVNGGENPMHESLVNRLSQMYAAIKEERTEEKDEHGNVTKWKEETPWRKAQDKDGRGKVTNMSDKARRESEKMAKKDVKENAHHDDDEEKKIRHLMRKYGWSRQEALEYFHYEKHDPKDYENMEESSEKRTITRAAKGVMKYNKYD